MASRSVFFVLGWAAPSLALRAVSRLRFLLRLRRRLVAELNSALLLDAGLFDGRHLPFHLPQLSRDVSIATNEERGGPEHHDSHARRYLIVCPLLVLCTRQLRSFR